MKIKKTFRHIEIMTFTTFFVNRFFHTRYEKKVNSRYNTHKKNYYNTQQNKSRIIEMLIEYNETNKSNQHSWSSLVCR